MNCRIWSLNSEASRRTVIDLFLRDIVARVEFNSMLRIFCELSMAVETRVGNKKRVLSGNHDYTIGHAGKKDVDNYSPPKDSHLIVVEAKKEWPDDSIWQCLAEAAAVHKTRKDSGKQNCNVWGVLSNANFWKFVHIDNGGKVRESNVCMLSIPRILDKSEVLQVYRFIHHVVKMSFEASPTTTPNGSLEFVLTE